MYARRMTMREIQGFLAEKYGTEVSPEFVSSGIPSLCGYSEEITTTLFRTSTLSACPTLKPARSNHTPPNRIHGTHRIPL